MREVFFDENSIDNGLRQAHKKLAHEGFDAYAFDDDELIDMYKKRGFEVIGSIQDPHYGTLHKIVIINGTKDAKDHVIATIRPHI